VSNYPIVSSTLIALIALLHIYILVLEMFLWDKSLGLKVFGHSQEMANMSKVLAANQGLYNGFLAVGLLWGLYWGAAGFHIKAFFLGCVLIAGVYGGITARRKILYIQAAPALAGLIALLLNI
jgi:putative membrane protein